MEWSLGTGFWSLATGHWALVAGFWSIKSIGLTAQGAGHQVMDFVFLALHLTPCALCPASEFSCSYYRLPLYLPLTDARQPYWITDLGLFRFGIWDCGFRIFVRKTSYFKPLQRALTMVACTIFIEYRASSIQKPVTSNQRPVPSSQKPVTRSQRPMP